MKRQFYILEIGLIALLALFIGCRPAQSQEKFSGKWEGMFMNDFRTLIQLNCDKEQGNTGKILMYDGNNKIQDDLLSRIFIVDDSLKFYIEAKVTDFKGTFSDDFSELSGIFVFPDGSEHPLSVKRKPLKDNEITADE